MKFWHNTVGMFKDKATPLRSKWLIVAGIVYILSPIDIIPDAIVGFGELDDLGVLIATVRLFYHTYNDYVKRHRLVNGEYKEVE